MSHTITTASVHEAHLRPNFTDADFRAVTRAAYRIDGYSAVVVTIRVGTVTAFVEVSCVNGDGGYWRHPTATQMRRLVDEALKPHGLARAGRVEDTGSGWRWTYPIEQATCPHTDCGYGECSGRWVNGACETHGNNEGRCQR